MAKKRDDYIYGREGHSLEAGKAFARAKGVEAKRAEPGQKKSRQPLPAPSAPQSIKRDSGTVERKPLPSPSPSKAPTKAAESVRSPSGGPTTRKGKRPPVAKDSGSGGTARRGPRPSVAKDTGGPEMRKGKRRKENSLSGGSILGGFIKWGNQTKSYKTGKYR